MLQALFPFLFLLTAHNFCASKADPRDQNKLQRQRDFLGYILNLESQVKEYQAFFKIIIMSLTLTIYYIFLIYNKGSIIFYKNVLFSPFIYFRMNKLLYCLHSFLCTSQVPDSFLKIYFNLIFFCYKIFSENFLIFNF